MFHLMNYNFLPQEHLRLQQLREEVVRLAQTGVCPVCRGKGWEQVLLEGHSRRLPGDGGEGQNSHTSHHGESSSKVSSCRKIQSGTHILHCILVFSKLPISRVNSSETGNFLFVLQFVLRK